MRSWGYDRPDRWHVDVSRSETGTELQAVFDPDARVNASGLARAASWTEVLSTLPLAPETGRPAAANVAPLFRSAIVDATLPRRATEMLITQVVLTGSPGKATLISARQDDPTNARGRP